MEKNLHSLFRIPTVLCHLRVRYDDLSQSIRARNSGKEQKIKYLNAVSRHFADVVFGVVILALLYHHDIPSQLAEALMKWADNLVSQLQNLFVWLMGSPAGLKLNSKLDYFYGRFFLYHIYLWTAYLQLMRSVLVDIIWCVGVSGVLGLSTQLAMVQDLLSMMTLHLYCFYVYAARLYSLQIYGLSSLWRLFRGKKWNVLRKRVDSASYDLDQLFIGTLLFTILLFLLPTTLVYYVVFTAVRLVAVIIQGVFHKITSAINKIPLYSICLRAISPSSVTDRVLFQVLGRAANGPLYIRRQSQAASFSTLWHSYGHNSPAEETHSWPGLISNLIMGQLIYPWIKPAS